VRRVRVASIYATPDDVTALQTQVQGYLKDLATCIQDCASSGKTIDSTVAEFVRISKRAAQFLTLEPTWVQANEQVKQGNAIVKQLLPIYAELKAAGCANVPTPPDLPAPDPDPGSFLSGYGNLLALGLIVFALHEAKGL
jgi:hypothetical protein